MPQLPLSLVVVEPYYTVNSNSVAVKGVVENGSTVTVNGNLITDISNNGEFSTNVSLHYGLNLIKIEVTKGDKTKTVYREVKSNTAPSSLPKTNGNNADLKITQEKIELSYSSDQVNEIRMYNQVGQCVLLGKKSNVIQRSLINDARDGIKNPYFITVEFINRPSVSYKVLW